MEILTDAHRRLPQTVFVGKLRCAEIWGSPKRVSLVLGDVWVFCMRKQRTRDVCSTLPLMTSGRRPGAVNSHAGAVNSRWIWETRNTLRLRTFVRLGPGEEVFDVRGRVRVRGGRGSHRGRGAGSGGNRVPETRDGGAETEKNRPSVASSAGSLFIMVGRRRRDDEFIDTAPDPFVRDANGAGNGVHVPATGHSATPLWPETDGSW